MGFLNIYNVTLLNLSIKNNINQIVLAQQDYGIFSFSKCQIINLIYCSFQKNNQLHLFYTQNSYTNENQTTVLENDVLVFIDVKIEQNIFPAKSILFIQSSFVYLNKLTYVQNEGSFLIMKSQNVTVINSYFSGNKAQNGGAIYFKAIQQIINFKTCQFEQNTALSSGGALYFENIPSCKVIFDSDTKIKNNRALIGGGLRIVQTDESQIQLPFGFPFIHNVYQNLADIYGNDSTSYLQNIIISDNNKKNTYFFTFYLNQMYILPFELQKSFSRLAEIKEFRSGGFIYFKIYIVDSQNRFLSFSKEMLVNNEYPIEIESELKRIQVSIYGLQSNQSLINGQQIINYYQYNSQSLAFEFSDLQIIGSGNELLFSVNSTIYTNSAVKQPILLSIGFRNCITGEVIQYINDQIYQCNQCLEGTYQINDPLQLYKQSIKGRSDINRCINCPESAIKCEGNKISLKNGFWRKSNFTDEIIECDPILNSCQAQNPLSINYCSTGYLGPICGQCDILGEIWKGSRYSESISQGVCQICGPKLNQWVYLVLKIILFEAYFLNVLNIFVQKFKYTQTCYYLRKLKIIPISSNSISDYSGFYIKIILNYYQISSILIQQPKIISINFNFLNEIFGSGDRQIQLGIDCLISEGIIQKLNKILFYTLIQFLVPIIALFFIPLTLKFYEYIGKVRLRKYHFYLLFHIIFIYFQMSQISYFSKSLTCREIGSQLYNPIDLTIQCYEASVVKYLYPFSLSVLSFWTLFPLVLLKQIKKNRKKLDQCIIKYKYGYYYGELKDKYYYWEFVRIYLKIAIIYLYTLLSRNNQYIAILAITILICFYLKIISQNNPFISFSIQKCEIASYILIILKIFLLAIQNQNPQTQRLIEISQIFIDYFFFFCFLLIVIGIMLSSSKSKLMIYVKEQLLKIISLKSLNKLVNFKHVSFKAYMKWKLVYKMFRQSLKYQQKLKKKQTIQNIKNLQNLQNIKNKQILQAKNNHLILQSNQTTQNTYSKVNSLSPHQKCIDIGSTEQFI
ncbi:transmembrane protein, putative (macronuclear) [Tetrahymena thermophila SB210]|uniref:Transmembrane protein, putative n=1 Tax=Tetrahymena thermophila (strain SB210) TaxID=312017 RepID=W7XKL6_TETTS|nr:transmembrane protein, putative [Tetrahymena thermophila SB210]EWS75009.1 transmembrane protein, putative [Tetrahymena thermophila SB210]|eukprot:XP_012652467.1 transmembrane protein, putative [Tetrahymena thermophila SB210]